jgi:hypothetical protein
MLSYLTLAIELCVLTKAAHGDPQSGAPDIKKYISIAKPSQSVLQLLIQLGLQEHTPLGIVLDGTGKLCSLPKGMTIKDVTVEQLLNTLLSGSGYMWLVKDGVIEVAPRQMPNSAQQVLNVTFDHFGSMKTTIQGMGIVLGGQIFSHFHPEQGVAGEILSSIDAETVPDFTLLNVSTEQILNHLVSTGSKGAWILSPPAEGSKETYDRLNTYGYKDDAWALGRVPCPGATGSNR